VLKKSCQDLSKTKAKETARPLATPLQNGLLHCEARYVIKIAVTNKRSLTEALSDAEKRSELKTEPWA